MDANVPVPPHPKSSLGFRSGGCGGHSLLSFVDLCEVVHYPAGSSLEKIDHCSHQALDMVSNNTQADCGDGTILGRH